MEGIALAKSFFFQKRRQLPILTPIHAAAKHAARDKDLR
jgi:hypothetical protein